MRGAEVTFPDPKVGGPAIVEASSVTFVPRDASVPMTACNNQIDPQEDEAMKYVLLIYQGTAWEGISSLSEDEKEQIGAQYAAVNQVPGVTPGLPLGLPEKAHTVAVQDSTTVTTDGPFIDANGAVGGYVVFEADDLDAAIELASRIPAARLGGAVEVRPVETYW
jgi:hypothetical protein